MDRGMKLLSVGFSVEKQTLGVLYQHATSVIREVIPNGIVLSSTINEERTFPDQRIRRNNIGSNIKHSMQT